MARAPLSYPASAAAGSALPSPSTPTARRRPVAAKSPVRPMDRFAESAGATAAECAAVFCCCPCGLLNLLLAVVLKLPAGLVRRALRRRRRRLRCKKGGGLGGSCRNSKGGAFRVKDDILGDEDLSLYPEALLKLEGSPSSCEELLELEREMLARFYGAGFWRSSSQGE